MEQFCKVGTRLRSGLRNRSRHIRVPVMCNVHRVTLIPNSVKEGCKTNACCLSSVHQSRLKRKCELLMHHIDPVALPNLSTRHQLLSQEPRCCEKKPVSRCQPALSGDVAFMKVSVIQPFSPSMNLAPPGNKSWFATISDCIKAI